MDVHVIQISNPDGPYPYAFLGKTEEQAWDRASEYFDEEWSEEHDSIREFAEDRGYVIGTHTI